MNKQIKNIFSISIGTVINTLLGFVTVPIITHLVDPVAYGKLGILQTYISIFASVCLLGLDQAYVRFYYNNTSVEYKRELSHKIIFIPICLSVILGILFIVFGSAVVKADSVTYFLVGFCIVISVLETFTKLCLRLEQKGSVYSAFLILHRISYAGIVISLVCFTEIDSVKAMLFGTGASLLINAVVTIIIKNNIWGFSKTDNSEVKTKELLKYAYPFVFSSVMGWLFTATGKLTLQRISTYEQIGFYSISCEIIALLAIIQTTFSTLWIPMAVESFEKNPENKEFFKESNDIITVIMTIAGFTVVLLKDVFGLVLGQKYIPAAQIFPCLVLQPMMFAISETTVYGINFYKKTKWHVVITSVCSAVNIIGNIILVPIFGAKGAAISMGVSYVIFFIVRTLIARKYYRIDFAFKKLTVTIVMTLAFFLYQSFTKTGMLSFIMYAVFLGIFVCMYFKTIKKCSIVLWNNLQKGTENVK